MPVISVPRKSKYHLEVEAEKAEMTIVVRFFGINYRHQFLRTPKNLIFSPYSTVYCGHFEALFVKIGRLCEE